MNELFIVSEMDELHKILDAVNERLRIVAMSVADSKKPSHNSRVMQCPTCGGDCTIGGDDKEGTHYYIPFRGART